MSHPDGTKLRQGRPYVPQMHSTAFCKGMAKRKLRGLRGCLADILLFKSLPSTHLRKHCRSQGLLCACDSNLTYLIVDIHDRDNGCVWPDGIAELVQIDEPITFNRQVGYIPAALLHVAAAVQHALICSSEPRDQSGLISVLQALQRLCLFSEPPVSLPNAILKNPRPLRNITLAVHSIFDLCKATNPGALTLCLGCDDMLLAIPVEV